MEKINKMDDKIEIKLPWPPTANKYWRIWNRRLIISTEARDYKKTIKQLYYTWDKVDLEGRLSVVIEAYPPDKRMRDLDNLLKITLDSLESTGLFKNDSQIDKIKISRKESIKGGSLDIFIEKISV